MVFRKSAKLKFAKICCIKLINNTIMAFLKYLQKEGHVRECSALSNKETEEVNERFRHAIKF